MSRYPIATEVARQITHDAERKIEQLESRLNSQTARLLAAERSAAQSEAKVNQIERELASMRAALLEIRKEQNASPSKTSAKFRSQTTQDASAPRPAASPERLRNSNRPPTRATTSRRAATSATGTKQRAAS